jgi:hypothetical protein
MPLPLVTLVWSDVPVIVAEVIAPAVDRTTSPLKLALAKLAAWPLKAIVGFPETPEPFVIDSPLPDTAIDLLASVTESVLT